MWLWLSCPGYGHDAAQHILNANLVVAVEDNMGEGSTTYCINTLAMAVQAKVGGGGSMTQLLWLWLAKLRSWGTA